MMSMKGVGGAGLLMLALIEPVSAALLGRLPATPGGTDYQAYYDTILDITWVADAELPATLSFGVPMDSYGHMSWDAANVWIRRLNEFSYLGFSDWRMPVLRDTGAPGCDFSYAGTDCGFNVLTGSAATTVYNEMASLWYDTLGNQMIFDALGRALPGSGWTQAGPFIHYPNKNLWSGDHWFGVSSAATPGEAWYFYSWEGLTRVNPTTAMHQVWAVRSGDVVPVAVPTPPILWLLGAGIALFGFVRSYPRS